MNFDLLPAWIDHDWIVLLIYKNSKWFFINVVFLRHWRMHSPSPFCMRYLRTINALRYSRDQPLFTRLWGVSRGGGCRSLGWTRWNIAPCSLTSRMNQSKSECPFKEMMTDRRWQHTIKVELSNFEANIERERKKDFEHDIAALFLQLTQVLIMSPIMAKGRITIRLRLSD